MGKRLEAATPATTSERQLRPTTCRTGGLAERPLRSGSCRRLYACLEGGSQPPSRLCACPSQCPFHTPVFAAGFYNPLCCLGHCWICVNKGRRICHVTSLIEMSCSESSMSISSLCRRAEIFIYPVSALIRLGSMEETGSRPVYVDRVMTMTRTHAPTRSGNSWRICKLAMTSRPE